MKIRDADHGVTYPLFGSCGTSHGETHIHLHQTRDDRRRDEGEEQLHEGNFEEGVLGDDFDIELEAGEPVLIHKATGDRRRLRDWGRDYSRSRDRKREDDRRRDGEEEEREKRSDRRDVRRRSHDATTADASSRLRDLYATSRADSVDLQGQIDAFWDKANHNLPR